MDLRQRGSWRAVAGSLWCGGGEQRQVGEVWEAAAVLLENEHDPCIDHPPDPFGLSCQEPIGRSVGLWEALCFSLPLQS